MQTVATHARHAERPAGRPRRGDGRRGRRAPAARRRAVAVGAAAQHHRQAPAAQQQSHVQRPADPVQGAAQCHVRRVGAPGQDAPVGDDAGGHADLQSGRAGLVAEVQFRVSW